MYEENGEVTGLEDAREQMRLLLEQMRSQGVKLFVDGEAALPGKQRRGQCTRTAPIWQIMYSEMPVILNKFVSTRYLTVNRAASREPEPSPDKKTDCLPC